MSTTSASQNLTQLFLVLSYFLAPPICLIAGLIGAALSTQSVYVDESALLAGFAAPQGEASSARIKLCPNETKLLTVAQRLQHELEQWSVEAEIFETHAAGNCSCTSVRGVVVAPYGASAGVIVLAVEVAEAPDLSDAADGRATDIAVRLVQTLSRARWLSKDVVFLLHARCSCACGPHVGETAAGVCRNSPLRQLLDDHHRLGIATSASPRTRLHRWGGPARQVVSFSLHSRALSAAPPVPASSMDAARADTAPAALAVELGGVDGRLANLDAFSHIWKSAARPSLHVPLMLPATGWLAQSLPLPRACAHDVAAAPPAVGPGAWWSGAWLVAWLPPRVQAALRTEHALALLGFALSLAWGAPRGEHAHSLAHGIDGVSLHGVPAHAVRCHKLRPLGDEQLLALLEVCMRQLSNLDEALHHSHYAYLLADPNTLLPLGKAVPWLHLPPPLALALRAMAHARARDADPRRVPHAALSFAAVAAAHVGCTLLLLLPSFSPYMAPLWHLAWPPSATSRARTALPPPPSTVALVATLQTAWAALALALAWAASHLPRRLHPDALCCASCAVACIVVFVTSCVVLPLGLVGSLILSACAVLCLPRPVAAAFPPPPSPAAMSAHRSWSLGVAWEALMLAASSPAALLAVATPAAPLAALVPAWQLAASSSTLPFAFGVAAVTPLCAVAASIRLRRLTALLVRGGTAL